MAHGWLKVLSTSLHEASYSKPKEFDINYIVYVLTRKIKKQNVDGGKTTKTLDLNGNLSGVDFIIILRFT